jgi:hypothetical protein
MARNHGHAPASFQRCLPDNCIHIRNNYKILKMASSTGLKRERREIDYKQLNSLSSVVLYDTARKSRHKGKLYEVERIITRRTVRYVSAYLHNAYTYTRSYFI